MEYKVIKNISDGFWEDKTNNSFGLDNKLSVKINKNIITIKSDGADLFLQRNNKKAKISVIGKIVKGEIKENDRLSLDNQVEIEIKVSLFRVNWNLWMGIFVLLIILVTTFFGWKKNIEINIEKIYQKKISEIKDNVLKSDNIKSIDPETGLKLLNMANEEILEIKSNKIHEAEINDLEKLINEKLMSSGSTEVIGFIDVYNTKSADIEDRNYDKMVVSNNDAVLSDSKTGKIILVNLDFGRVTKFNVGQEIIDLIYANKKIFFYDGRNILDSTKNKVAEVDDIVYSKIINWNNSWYLLGQEGKISKLADNKITLWTSDTAKLIDKPISMAIDGTVWVIGENGEVLNYEKGIVKKWTPSLKITGEKIIGITTTADSTKLGIISDRKVMVFEKASGKLLATHNFEKIGIIEAKMGLDNQIYVLGTDQKIYKVK